MLSLDDKRYEIPRRVANGWQLEAKNEKRIIETPFHYTFHSFDHRGSHYEGKYTFIYDGNSVKPSYRTLRIYGAEKLEPIISALSCRKVKDANVQKERVQAEEFDVRSFFKKHFTRQDGEVFRLIDSLDALTVRGGLIAKGTWNQDAEALYQRYYK